MFGGVICVRMDFEAVGAQEFMYGILWFGDAGHNGTFINMMLEKPDDTIRAYCRKHIGEEREQEIYNAAISSETVVFPTRDYLCAFNDIVTDEMQKRPVCFCGSRQQHKPLAGLHDLALIGLAKMLAGTFASCVRSHHVPHPQHVGILNAGMMYLFGCRSMTNPEITPEEVFAGVAFCAGNLCWDQSVSKRRKINEGSP